MAKRKRGRPRIKGTTKYPVNKYHFPEQGVTIEASSLEEAEALLPKALKEKD